MSPVTDAIHSLFLWCLYFILLFCLSHFNMRCLHVSRNGNLIFEYDILDYWLPSQYHMQLLLLQATPNVFQPAAQHYDSQSTFCALIGGRRSQVLKIKMKMMEEAWRRKRWPTKGALWTALAPENSMLLFCKRKTYIALFSGHFPLKAMIDLLPNWSTFYLLMNFTFYENNPIVWSIVMTALTSYYSIWF